jgi:hypothetical protein
MVFPARLVVKSPPEIAEEFVSTGFGAKATAPTEASKRNVNLSPGERVRGEILVEDTQTKQVAGWPAW